MSLITRYGVHYACPFAIMCIKMAFLVSCWVCQAVWILALVVALAVDALGAEAVKAVMMPSDYTADISRTDAQQLADNLGITLDTIPIEAGCAGV